MSRFSKWAVLSAVCALATLTPAVAGAQWLKLKTPGIPRTPDGKPDLEAPAPRQGDKPDLSGLWRFNSESYSSNVTVDLKPEEIDPKAVELYKQRMEDLGKEDPSTFRCLPSGARQTFAPSSWVRIIQTPTVIALLYEDLIYRQIFMDGRDLPKDPNPSFMGYSVGRWDGDTLIVESIGFNETTWLDFGGHPHSEALKITERFRRTDLGHLDVQVRFEDPAYYRRAWEVPLKGDLITDTDTIEYVCAENQKDFAHLVGKASDEKKFAVKVAPQVLSKYVGTYSFKDPADPGNIMRFNVTLRGDSLFMDIGGKDKQEMIALSEKTFSMMGIRIDFESDHLIAHIVEGDMKATKDTK
jgi:hypothetical protein